MSAAPERTVERAVLRAGGDPAAVVRRWRERYLTAQRLYLARDRPLDRADIVVRNDDPGRPGWRIRADPEAHGAPCR